MGLEAGGGDGHAPGLVVVGDVYVGEVAEGVVDVVGTGGQVFVFVDAAVLCGVAGYPLLAAPYHHGDVVFAGLGGGGYAAEYVAGGYVFAVVGGVEYGGVHVGLVDGGDDVVEDSVGVVYGTVVCVVEEAVALGVWV